MGENGLLDAIGELFYPGVVGRRTPERHLDGHGAGHVCLEVPDEESVLRSVEELTRRHGSPRALAVDGAVDPAVTERTGLPLLAPFGERVVEMRARMYGGRWVGYGTVRDDHGGTRPVVLVSKRRPPTADEFRMLTDPEHPHSIAEALDAHWFDGYEDPDPERCRGTGARVGGR
ncbi:hypothetical protein [Streptomyces macrosporus]|uniref:Uncharacterized protein n=1 Tax=Streptomyces macrosporus TaxID=44032 RepID=A0ABN3KHY3_9ACTN